MHGSGLSRQALREAGDEAMVVGQRTWNGVALLVGGDGPIEVRRVLFSPSVRRQLRSAGVDHAVRGMEKTSDHAPVWIEIDPH